MDFYAIGLFIGCVGKTNVPPNDGETAQPNSETGTSLGFALECGYSNEQQHSHLTSLNREVGRILGAMLTPPKPFLQLRLPDT